VARAPETEWVADGTATLFLATNLDKLNDFRAEQLYLDFLERFPEHPEAASGDVLVRILPDLSEEGTRRVNEHMRTALVRVWERLDDKWTKRRLKGFGVPEPTEQELRQAESEGLP